MALELDFESQNRMKWMKILIVDDQASARTLLKKILQEIDRDAEFHEFKCPTEAMDWCRTNVADLIVIDYEMPEMDGLQFTRELKLSAHLRDIPVILVTVVIDDNLRVDVLESGVDDILTKPVIPREMKARAARLISQHRRIQRLEAELAEHRRQRETAP